MKVARDGSASPDILIVDDDPAFLDEIVEGLEQEGINAAASRSADDAVAIVSAGPPVRVVVTDLHMPGGSGLELLWRLSTLDLPVRPVAIVITGRASVEHAIAALRLNAVDFLRKPVSAAEVAAAIRRARSLVDVRVSGGELATGDQARAQLQAMIDVRVERDRVFGNSLFPDPTWRIMLDLALAELTGRKQSVSSLCLASGVPPTTALRRLHRLEVRGLIRREQDETDLRRVWIFLTEHGHGEMRRFLDRIGSAPERAG